MSGSGNISCSAFCPQPTPTPTPTVTITQSITPTQTITPTITLTPTQTITPTLTITPTYTVTPTATPFYQNCGYGCEAYETDQSCTPCDPAGTQVDITGCAQFTGGNQVTMILYSSANVSTDVTVNFVIDGELGTHIESSLVISSGTTYVSGNVGFYTTNDMINNAYINTITPTSYGSQSYVPGTVAYGSPGCAQP
jgi:hypothetical protein